MSENATILREPENTPLMINQKPLINQKFTFNHELSFQIVPYESI